MPFYEIAAQILFFKASVYSLTTDISIINKVYLFEWIVKYKIYFTKRIITLNIICILI